ncbi:MAG: hypothetical protein ACOCXA_04635, partial [Planctomycetota bacterium]
MSTYQNYGRFVPDCNSFVLTDEPPRKWVNVLCTRIGEEEMWNECTHLGDGMSRIRDRDGNQLQLTSYDSKHCYLRDEDDGTVFCPFGEPGPTPVQDRSVTIHPAQTVIAGSCRELHVEQRIFVPDHEPVEVWTVTARNDSDRQRRVSVFAYALFALTGTDAEGTGFWKETYAQVHQDLKGVFCTNRLPGLPIDWA